MTQFFVSTTPRAQQRPRVVRSKGGVHAYTPSQTKEAQWEIRQAAIEAGVTMLEGPVKLRVMVRFARPKSHTKKQRSIFKHTTKPDAANLGALISDALEGVCYSSDSQVSSLWVFKEYAAEGAPAGWTVTVEAG